MAAPLETAEQVAQADLDTLQSLVDNSLLRHTGERFWMLETIREYGLERLESTAEAAHWRQRHAEHFIALARQAEEGERRAEQGLWWDRLEADQLLGGVGVLLAGVVRLARAQDAGPPVKLAGSGGRGAAARSPDFPRLLFLRR